MKGRRDIDDDAWEAIRDSIPERRVGLGAVLHVRTFLRICSSTRHPGRICLRRQDRNTGRSARLSVRSNLPGRHRGFPGLDGAVAPATRMHYADC